MNMASAVCAPSTKAREWHSIDWATAHASVRKLQARIVKATQEGRPGRARALQWLLTHSFFGKAIAIKRVTENQGKRTAGVDGEIWSTPKSKSDAISTLGRRLYSPLPLKRVRIPKANGDTRPLGIPTMTDRAMQALHLLGLAPIAESTADRDSYGFRPGRSCADAIGSLFTTLSQRTSAQWILEADIKGCFDNISHEWLLTHVPMDRVILRKWLKAGFMEHRQLFPTEAGTPQGGIISPTLANLALDGLGPLLKWTFRHRRHRVKGAPRGTFISGPRHKVNFVRYADDFVVTGASKEILENEVRPLIEKFLAERGLILSPTKTQIVNIRKGFDFLGQNIRKYGERSVMLIMPSSKSIASLLRRVREIARELRGSAQETLIRQLNPLIRGWVNYHRHVVSGKVFSDVRSAIWTVLWNWARRRHSNKRRPWIAKRYFHRRGSRGWIFGVTTELRRGEVGFLRLVDPIDTRIVRHVRIRTDANPYDPKDEPYFEERNNLRIERSLAARRTLLALWRGQDGLCPGCGQKINEITGWHNHHVIRRSRGGPDQVANRVLMHPTCHMQFHHRSLVEDRGAGSQSNGSLLEA